MKKRPLIFYVIGVLITLFIVNVIIFYTRGHQTLIFVEVFSGGYLVGMLGMYIAVHLYRWK